MENPAHLELGKILVIIPTFNEIESLPLIVTGLREQVPAVHLLIVDDNSPDGTGELADQMANTDAN